MTYPKYTKTRVKTIKKINDKVVVQKRSDWYIVDKKDLSKGCIFSHCLTSENCIGFYGNDDTEGKWTKNIKRFQVDMLLDGKETTKVFEHEYAFENWQYDTNNKRIPIYSKKWIA